MQGKWGGCIRITSQPGLAQAGSIPPSRTTIRTWVSCNSASGLQGCRVLWSMVDVLQAWADVTSPAKHSQRALDHLSQQGCSKDSRAQAVHPGGCRASQISHGSTEVGDQNNTLPTLTGAASAHSALDDPPSNGGEWEPRARGTVGDIEYRCRPAGAHGQQLKVPGLKPATGTSGEVN